MKKHKIAIVISGGGMLTAYNAGVVSALRRYLHPDVIIAWSGGSGLASYYAADQLTDETEINVWTKHLATKKMINPWRLWKIFDADYLMNIIKNVVPLDLERLRAARTRLEITALSTKTGEIRYFNEHEDVFKAIQASHAVPAMAKPIEIDGEVYVDSFASSHVYNHVERAFEIYDVDKVIVINCIRFMKKPLKYELCLQSLFRSRDFYEKLKDRMDDLLYNYHFFGKVTSWMNNVKVIQPRGWLKMSPMCVDGEKLWDTFQKWYEEARYMENEILEFLSQEAEDYPD